MQHVDPDRLALLALGEQIDSADEAELTAHLGDCLECQQELRSLRSTVELAREAASHRDQTMRPPASVWRGIVTELGFSPGNAHPETHEPESRRAEDMPAASFGDRVDRPHLNNVGRLGDGGHSTPGDEGRPGPGSHEIRGDAGVPGAGSHEDPGVGWRGPQSVPSESDAARTNGARGERRRGTQVWRRVGALAAAAAVGVLGTVAVTRPWAGDPAVVATGTAAVLEPVAGGPSGVHGEVTVLRTATGPELRVSTAGLPTQTGFYQVWVFDGSTRMQAVGVLGGDRTATFPLPATLDLRTFNVVDISLEPYDGDQTHSATSVLRGTLTN